jgi:hypothetical protein
MHPSMDCMQYGKNAMSFLVGKESQQPLLDAIRDAFETQCALRKGMSVGLYRKAAWLINQVQAHRRKGRIASIDKQIETAKLEFNTEVVRKLRAKRDRHTSAEHGMVKLIPIEKLAPIYFNYLTDDVSVHIMALVEEKQYDTLSRCVQATIELDRFFYEIISQNNSKLTLGT